MKESQSKILVVDDEASLLFSLIAFLEDENFIVTGASTGEEALELLKNEAFDAAIVDMRLPGIDGNEVILRAHETGYHTRFLIHTGSTDYQLPSSLINIGYGPEDIFLKPISDLGLLTEALLSRIER